MHNKTQDPRTIAPRSRMRGIVAFSCCASLILAAALALGMQFASAPAYAAEPGSSGDPIALKSYVDAQISELEKRVEQLSSENEALKKAIQEGTGVSSQPAPATGSPSRFEVLHVESGQRMLMGAGTELVLRTGSAQAIRGELGSVVDLITGEDLDSGVNVRTNHLLISSRNDNRGVRFTADAYILVKGDYDMR